ncbi:conserved hypothetical protein [Trichinella spiralis]|uniref:hypothetical protein n=1 Tax=Trichinella spiralis TaxID=6334 RepID=UPI0001EFC5F7|nr:conserved hypothetical protein [Trichinella spiralis]
MPRCNLLSVKTDSKTIGITSLAEFLWCFFCSGQRDKSCSHHFVLYLASQTSLDRTVFDPMTFPSCSSVVSLIIKQIPLSQSSSVRTNPDKVLVVLVAVSAFPLCGLRHPMKLVPFPSRVRISRASKPSATCLDMFTSVCSKCGITNIRNWVRKVHILSMTALH